MEVIFQVCVVKHDLETTSVDVRGPVGEILGDKVVG